MLSSTYSEKLPDHLKPATDKIEKQVRKKKIALAVLVSATLVFFGLAIYFGLSGSIKNLESEKEQLTKENDLLKQKSASLKIALNETKIANADLIAKQESLQAILNENNQQINDMKQNIMENCNVSYQKLKFNETNMEAFTISTDIVQENDAPTSHIAIINASHNSMQSFSNNYLPDLQTLDLSSNPLSFFSNNTLLKLKDLRLDSVVTLTQFDQNTLSYVKVLNLSGNKIESFGGNKLPLVQEINLDKSVINTFAGYDLPALKKFSMLSNSLIEFRDNNFPSLESFQVFTSTSNLLQIFTNNNFGKVTSLYHRNNASPLKISNNNMPELKELTIADCKLTEYTDFMTNNFPHLEALKFNNVVFKSLSYFPALSSLKSLQISGSLIGIQFANHGYLSLQNLTISSVNIVGFRANNIRSLKRLSISNANLITSVCDGNYFTQLAFVSFVGMSRLEDISCLSSYKEMEEIEVSGHSIKKFDNFNLTKLTILEISKGKLQSFSGNYLPSLTYLSLELQGIQVPLNDCASTLKKLSILGAGSLFSNYVFEALGEASIAGDGTRDIIFQNNTLKSAYTIEIQKAKSLSFKNNILYRQISLNLYYIGDIKISNDAWDYLVTLSIQGTNITSFSNFSMCCVVAMAIRQAKITEFQGNNFPMLASLTITSTKITTIDCRKMTAIRELYLSYNSLTSSIADTLISCFLKSLEYVDLRGNPFSDAEKETITAKLKEKYPKLTIII